MVNTAFTNYLDQFNLTEELEFPILINETTSEFTLLVFLNKSKFDESLFTAILRHLKTILLNINRRKKFFIGKRGMI